MKTKSNGRGVFLRVIVHTICSFFFIAIFSACEGEKKGGLSEAPGLAEGREVFGEYCIRCHANGVGDQVNPPLIGSATLQDESRLANIILHGQMGESVVKGIMPAMPDMTDEEIVAVITYVRASFADLPTTITAEEVSRLRQ